jgi:hypothetical protein
MTTTDVFMIVITLLSSIVSGLIFIKIIKRLTDES